ncbi:MAG TPA: hypothetical protein DDW52_19040 [Planctomycetaceae bacterium]|nr:hypothetical protein [Planctomycetaceae bacterium]
MSKQPDSHKDLAVYWFKTQKSWDTWLKRYCGSSDSIWLMFAKKNSGQKSITYEQARETALSYGWIDGLINKYSDEFCVRKFSHRRPRSTWSKINRGIAEELIEQNRMKPSGLAEVQAAKQDGRWDAAYDSPATIQVPADLAAKLKANPKVGSAFARLSASERFSALVGLQTAKQDATRARRLQKLLESLAEHEPIPKVTQKGNRTTKLVVLLLRAVNVGGKNKLPMADVRKALLTPDFEDVSTLLQSGNIVCRTQLKPSCAADQAAQLIKKQSRIQLDCLAVSGQSWQKIIADNPFVDCDPKFTAATILQSRLTKSQLAALSEHLSKDEQIQASRQVLYQHCPHGFRHSKITAALIEKKTSNLATSRNFNTVQKIASALDDLG